ncbi:NAD(P)-dependent oxidoreductase [Jiangella asiatica]|uniref:NAD(P)-dependent oxidoreductase n=1 Tax=Jiangella asiatica TaxID=2530372 RepID=A0A4R5DD67_9ACTN|nr:NAD(P)-binding domain-containing protein [Jiangella asiatica]TDE10967.1 NAD(P)-dependent oxidoreductase [Jiangella asiatica]
MSQNDRPAVTLLGLGAMGRPMARALLGAGHPTTVWNRTPSRADELVAAGAIRADTVADAVTASPLVLACLLNYEVTYELLEPVTEHLAGRTLVNLSTGTPQEARDMAAWAAGRGIDYVDAGMMATPPMIGTEASLFLYSGSDTGFERYRPTLELFGVARHLGADAGRASLYDLALLSSMYAMFAGFLHGAALVSTAGISAADFAEAAGTFVRATSVSLPAAAELIDSGDYTTDVQSVDFNKAALDRIVQVSMDHGIGVDVVAPIKALLDRQVAEGHGAESFDRIVEGIKHPGP